MRFAPDEDQRALRDGVAAVFAKRVDGAAVRAAWPPGPVEPLAELWAELAELGLPAILAAEDVGGLGLDWVTAVLVLEEAGRVALPLPLIETMAVAVPLMAAAGDPAGMLTAVLAGELVVSVVSGSMMPGAGLAGAVIVPGHDGVAVHRINEVDLEPVTSVDGARRLGRVTARDHGTTLPGVTRAGIAELGALGAAAELVGLGARMLDMTVAYVKGRTQFGVPVGGFQAVKHHLADALLALTFARPAVWQAAYAVDHDLPERARSVSMAKAMASDAATLAARTALQCHGAMGYTDEYDLHLWMKRAWALAGAYGGAAWHRDRVGDLLGIRPVGASAHSPDSEEMQ